MTFSFFNYLVLEQFAKPTAEEEKQILAHELAHIKGGHYYELIFIALQKIVLGFNPLIYTKKNFAISMSLSQTKWQKLFLIQKITLA